MMTDFRPENETSEQLKTETSEANREDQLAELVGFDTNLDESADLSNSSTSTLKDNVPLLSDEELDEQITRHSFASSPISKLVFVAGGMLLLVFVLSLVISGFQSNSNTVSATKNSDNNTEKQTSKLVSNDNQDKEKEELLSELALKEQKEHLKALQSNKIQTINSAKKLPANTPIGQPVANSANSSASPTPVPQPQVNAKTNSQRHSSRYRPSTQKYSPIPRPSFPLIAQANQVDSSQSWKQVSEVGSFGGGSNSNSSQTGSTRPNFNSSAPSYNPSSQRSSSSLYQPSTFSNFNRTDLTSEVPVINNNNPQAITFGQSVSGVLETTIAWESSFGNQNEKSSDEQYLITLAQALKDKSGKEQIPAGSKLIVRLDGKTTALVTLSAESIIINGVTFPLPQGALKIRSPDGQPLIAESRTIGGSNNSDNSLLDILSLVGSVGNVPLSNINRFFGSGNSNNSFGRSVNVYFLPEGKNLQIFINKAFALKNSTSSEASKDKPLELNLPDTNQK